MLQVLAGRRGLAGVSRAGLVGALAAVAVIAYLVVQSFQLEAAVCEVCMSYRGRQMCRTVGGSTEKEAREAAITNACAFLASGVTDGMACQRQPPDSESCR